MKRKETILNNIDNNNDIQKYIKAGSWFNNSDFFNHAIRYIKAIKQGRSICSIGSVSKSGMSRTIKFLECSGSVKNGFRYYNFYALFCSLGYNPVNNSNYFRIGGCGMDMIFHTNYTIIHRLKRLGFLSYKECAHLAQETPNVI